MTLKEELSALFGANVPLISLVTYEEERVLECLRTLQGQLGVYAWDAADNLFQCICNGPQPLPNAEKEYTSDKLLPFLAQNMPNGTVVVLKDFHHAWQQKRRISPASCATWLPSFAVRTSF